MNDMAGNIRNGRRWMALLCLLMLTACNRNVLATDAIEDVSPEQAWALLQADASIQVLDVRTPEEVAQGTLPRLTAVADWYDWDRTWPQAREKLDPSRPVLVYCRSGRRSAAAAAKLAEAGFSRVLNLVGGIQAWRAAGLPVE